jgi:hypothetical protein
MEQNRGEVSCWWVDIKPNQIWRRLNMQFTYLNFPENTHVIVTDVNKDLANVSFRDLSDGKTATVGRYAFYKTFTISREESKR